MCTEAGRRARKLKIMTLKRKERFHAAVAEAARAIGPVKRRGRPVPENLTDEGRRKGLEAAKMARTCRAKRRDGHACRAKALRGSTRCVKHGGRVEVPAHPSNIRRFFNAELKPATLSQSAFSRGKSAWGSLTCRQRRELLDALPDHVIKRQAKREEVAILWIAAENMPCGEWRRRWNAVTRSRSMTE